MKNLSDVVTLLLEVLRGRAGKWDAVKDAIRSKDRAVGLVTVILALVPPVLVPLVLVALAVLFAAAR